MIRSESQATLKLRPPRYRDLRSSMLVFPSERWQFYNVPPRKAIQEFGVVTGATGSSR